MTNLMSDLVDDQPNEWFGWWRNLMSDLVDDQPIFAALNNKKA